MSETSPERFRLGTLGVDLVRRELSDGDGVRALTRTEVTLLAYLARHAGRTVPLAELLAEVWGYSASAKTRAISHAVLRLRKKLGESASAQLVSVRGQGLRLELSPAQEAAGLPSRPPGFEGRDQALSVLRRFWKQGGCCTVTGPGGIGKTRLARELAHLIPALHPPAEGPVLWCALDMARDHGALVRAAIATLKVPALRRDSTAMAETIGRALRGRGRCLLVLDNLEQLDESAVAQIHQWIRGAPELRVLCTSRCPLALPGEQVLALGPLALPEAVALLQREARRMDPTFAPGPEERAVLQRIARQLDRLPLALELAAPRLVILGCRGLADALTRRFRVLRGADRVARHATMRATIDWSWALLGQDERTLLAQCSVFRTGFTLAATQAVVAMAEDGWLDALQGLLHQSLLRRVPGSAPPRFSTFESIREFAAEQLGPQESAARDRHLDWIQSTAEAARWQPSEAIHDLLLEGAAGLAWARQRGRAEQELALAVALDALSSARIPIPTRMARIDAPLKRTDGGPRLAALRTRAELLRISGDNEAALADLAAAEALLAPLDREQAARIALTRGAVYHQSGRFEAAEAAYRAALADFVHLGLVDGQGMAHTNLALLLDVCQQPEQAEQHNRAAVRVLSETGLERLRTIALNNLAVSLQHRGHHGEAAGCAREALLLARSAGLPERQAPSLVTLGNIARVQGESVRAGEHYAMAHRSALSIGDTRSAALAALNQASVAMERGALEEAESALRPLKHDPEWRGLAWANLGVLRRLQGYPIEAAAVLRRAVAEAPDGEFWRPLALAHLGAALADLDQRDEARSVLLEAAEDARKLAHPDTTEVTRLSWGHLSLSEARSGAPEALAEVEARLKVAAQHTATDITLAHQILARALVHK